MKHKIIASFMAVIAFIGILDTSYLTYKQLLDKDIVCSLLDGCEVVLNSTYATILGFPLSTLGLLYYLTLLVIAILMIKVTSKSIGRVHLAIVSLGLIASAYLVYLQAEVINSWCQYCLVSAVTTAILFILSLSYSLTKK